MGETFGLAVNVMKFGPQLDLFVRGFLIDYGFSGFKLLAQWMLLVMNNNRSVGWNNNRPMNNFSGWSNRTVNSDSGNNTNRSMNFVRGILEENGRDMIGVPQRPRYTLEQNADIVYVKMLRNNCFVTLRDSNDSRSHGTTISRTATAGCLVNKEKKFRS
ncbi:hypothetical protein RJ639_018884 [Escallonia herrerae]|uniref:Uncharacterized protein n=1 Tax=Escallonia herrerae TaxID=1293975 RepID=A0AA89AIG2_9ASTE|nr:hypothetical protein RJ639_018884 [Escallonia herrerae]